LSTQSQPDPAEPQAQHESLTADGGPQQNITAEKTIFNSGISLETAVVALGISNLATIVLIVAGAFSFVLMLCALCACYVWCVCSYKEPSDSPEGQGQQGKSQTEKDI
jgi:Ca2+/Na+ antiporter